MSFEEEAAYALASWRRFDSEVTDELARAITSAFVLVAVADGDLAQSEINRFDKLINEQASLLDPKNVDRFDQLFRDIGGAIMSDPVAGRSHALELIAAVKANDTHCKLVLSAAEIAIVADNRELASEHEVMEQICAAMDIEAR
jgi:tellurite resistance protein